MSQPSSGAASSGAPSSEQSPEQQLTTAPPPDGDVVDARRLPRLHAGGRSPEPWSRRAAALRASLPQLARNPVVVGASTVAVTLAARVALEVARRALAGPTATAPVRVEVTGHVMHHVHVVQHVHVVHHASSPIGWPALSAPPRR